MSSEAQCQIHFLHARAIQTRRIYITFNVITSIFNITHVASNIEFLLLFNTQVLKTCHFMSRRGCVYQWTQNLGPNLWAKLVSFSQAPQSPSRAGRDRFISTFRSERLDLLGEHPGAQGCPQAQKPSVFLFPPQMTANLGSIAAHPRPPWVASWMTSTGTRSSSSGSASR